MNFIQNAAMQSGLIVNDISYSGSSSLNNSSQEEIEAANVGGQLLKLANYTIDGEFNGNYTSFKNFLLRLEFSSRLIAVDSIEIGTSSVIGANASQNNINAEEQKKANMVDPILNFKVKLVVNYYNTSGSSAENANVDSASAVSDLN